MRQTPFWCHGEKGGFHLLTGCSKQTVVAWKPKSITELEAFAHEEWAKILIEMC